MVDVLIIGSGVVGSLLASYLSRYDLNILIIEKELDPGNKTSAGNSGIIHAGYDPAPGTLKALLNKRGNELFKDLVKRLDVEYENNGALILSFTPDDDKKIKELKKRGENNGVITKILTKEETLKLAPNVNPDIRGSLYAETSGVINPFELVYHALENAVDNGAVLKRGEKVKNITPYGRNFLVYTTDTSYEARIVINCAGSNAKTIASFISNPSWDLTYRKGEYYVLDHFDDCFMTPTIFSCPIKEGKGVLFTRTTNGNYLVGPSNDLTNDPHDFGCEKDILDQVFLKGKRLVPSLSKDKVIRVFSGMRSGSTTGDFIIESDLIYPGFINVAGIDSPGLASSPAIAEYVIEKLIKPRWPLKEKENYIPNVKPYFRSRKLSLDELDKVIKEDPTAGQRICNCEKVTFKEVNDIMSRSVYPKTLKGFKRLTRAGFGKCQGSFCRINVLNYLAKKFHRSISEIFYDDLGSNFARYPLKKGEDDGNV